MNNFLARDGRMRSLLRYRRPIYDGHDLIYSTPRLDYIEVGGFSRGYEFDLLTLTPECQQMVSGQCQKVSKLVSHDLWC